MRLHLFSDLHLEFASIEFSKEVRSGELADLVLLAGDIHGKRRAVEWAAATFSQLTAMIGGNHEGYQDSLYAMIAANRRRATAEAEMRSQGLRYLEREAWYLEMPDRTPVRILGATLWTDFELFGQANRRKMMAHAINNLNDFRFVKVRGGIEDEKRLLNPADTSFYHQRTVEFLALELRKSFNGVTIVMTHHAPSVRSLPPGDRDDPLSACYASELDPFIEEHQPDLWVHGHVHVSNDYRIGTSRIVSNPRGYPQGRSNSEFDPALVIEI